VKGSVGAREPLRWSKYRNSIMIPRKYSQLYDETDWFRGVFEFQEKRGKVIHARSEIPHQKGKKGKYGLVKNY